MSLKKLLVEIGTDTLFHFTTIFNMVSIVKDDQFTTSNVLGSSADQEHNKNKFYFFSTQRSGSGKLGYAKYQREVRIVLDGRKLSQKYKIKPVDYWQVSRTPSKTNDPDEMNRRDELEDRVMLDDGEIRNATSYIDRVDVMVDPNDQRHVKLLTLLDRYSEGKFEDIYYFTKDQETDWNNQRVSNATQNIQDIINPEYDKDTDENLEHQSASNLSSNLVPLLFFIDEKAFLKGVEIALEDRHFKEFFNDNRDANEYKPFNSFEDYMKDRIQSEVEELVVELSRTYGYRVKEKVTTLKGIFHNVRSSRKRVDRKLSNLFIKTMKELNLNTVEEVIDFAIKKATDEYNN